MWFSLRRPIYTTRGLCCLLNALLWQRYQQCSQIDLLRTNKRSSSVNFEENSHDTNVFKQCWLIGLLKEKTDSAKHRSFTTILWTHRAQKTYLDNYVVSHTNACNWNMAEVSQIVLQWYPLLTLYTHNLKSHTIHDCRQWRFQSCQVTRAGDTHGERDKLIWVEKVRSLPPNHRLVVLTLGRLFPISPKTM